MPYLEATVSRAPTRSCGLSGLLATVVTVPLVDGRHRRAQQLELLPVGVGVARGVELLVPQVSTRPPKAACAGDGNPLRSSLRGSGHSASPRAPGV